MASKENKVIFLNTGFIFQHFINVRLKFQKSSSAFVAQFISNCEAFSGR